MATYQDSRYNIALPSGSGGAIVHIKTLTASSSATLSFVDGSSDVVLDNTYRTYVFKFINIHPATDNKSLTFQTSTNGGSSYGVTLTSTLFYAYHKEDDSQAALAYDDSSDLAQSTSFQHFMNLGNDNDQSGAGTLTIFNPSSTTFVKHYMSNTQYYEDGDRSFNTYTAGYFNTTSAINAVQFKMASGNIDAGTIKLYGIA